MSTDDRIPVGALRALAASVFEAAGSSASEAQLVGNHLVDANLAGHDSHGVIRIAKYLDWHARGLVLANQHPSVVKDSPCHAVVDGNFGYGQVIGHEAIGSRDGNAQRAPRHPDHAAEQGKGDE